MLFRSAVMFGGTAIAIATLVFTGLITPRAVSLEAVAAEPGVTTLAIVDDPSPGTPDASASTTVVAADTTSTVTTSPSPITDSGSPVAVDDAAATDEDMAVAINVTANDLGGSLSIIAFDVASATGGTVDCSEGSCTYTPPADYSGSDTFAYSVGGSGGEADRKSVV